MSLQVECERLYTCVAQSLAASGSVGWAATAALVLIVPLPVFALLARTLARWVREVCSGEGARVGE